MWAGHVTITAAALFRSASGRALLTSLALSWGTPGWIVIALIAVAAAVVSHPAARAAERYRDAPPRGAAPVPRMGA